MIASAVPTSRAVTAPTDAELERAGDVMDGRCHASVPYLRAEARDGASLVLFTEEEDGVLSGAGVALQRAGRLFARLSFPTPPVVSAGATSGLWQAIRSYCRMHRVHRLTIQSFEGTDASQPPLGHLRGSVPREEFVLDLSPSPDQILAGFSENHRRNIRKAQKNGLALTLESAPEGADAHADLFRSSMERRAARGEDVGLEIDRERTRTLLQTGAGVLAMVRQEGRLLASLLILVTRRRAYYHSGGSAPDGMKLGASQHALWGTAQLLRERGVELFCLGGAAAGDSEGLIQFKLGFNPRRIALAHHIYDTELPLRWRVLRRLLGQ